MLFKLNSQILCCLKVEQKNIFLRTFLVSIPTPTNLERQVLKNLQVLRQTVLFTQFPYEKILFLKFMPDLYVLK